jgi:hypothetical protein
MTKDLFRLNNKKRVENYLEQINELAWKLNKYVIAMIIQSSEEHLIQIFVYISIHYHSVEISLNLLGLSVGST